MASRKSLGNLTEYKSVLPYASELFGIYQPLLGWKSERILDRVGKNPMIARIDKLNSIIAQLKPMVEGQIRNANGEISDGFQLHAAIPNQKSTGSKLLSLLQAKAHAGEDLLEITKPENIDVVLQQVRTDYIVRAGGISTDIQPAERQAISLRMESEIKSESLVAGLLTVLHENNQSNDIKKLLLNPQGDVFANLINELNENDWLDRLNPADKRMVDNVGLSPIGVVHLFKQYFFELDSFLGMPVGHIWLSPGSSVELIETSSRRTLTEKTSETAYESTQKSERTVTEQEEISDSVKEENQQNLKLGASATVNQGWVTGSFTGNTTLGYEDTQKTAREQAHKHMRNQSEKISSEIKKNYKSTFKVVTETTDTSSKRYVLNNTTSKLINYEMRRKMRHVCVQVQDVGSYLCWQTFVDDPGAALGVAELMHIAKAADTSGEKPYEPVKRLEPFTSEKAISIPFSPVSGNGPTPDEPYGGGGWEINRDTNEGLVERIQNEFREYVVCPQSNFNLRSVTFNTQGASVTLKVKGIVREPDGRTGFDFYFDFAHFQNRDSMEVKAICAWEPDAQVNAAIDGQNENAKALAEQKRLAEEQKAYMEAVKQRITACSKIASRRYDDLREEERIVVYRKLIDDLLPPYYQHTDDNTRHKLSELLNAIFDIEKMLYFVAPEYWRPRLHEGHQTLGKSPSEMGQGTSSAGTSTFSGMNKAQMHTSSIVATAIRNPAAIRLINPAPKTNVGKEHLSLWGGQGRKDNYFITEDSEVAPMGASLGWLLQLDGDERRNAFLNAPWVKAVMPVRPGKEMAAINWLRKIEGQQIDFDIAELEALALRVQQKHGGALTVGEYPDSAIDEPDPTARVMATPVDRVYEHGFYPLQGGFRTNIGGDFEVFDQWSEVLPTDQVVPVEVQYDPISGRMLPPSVTPEPA